MANEFILILDFGGSKAQAMAHKLRNQNYYCEVHPCSMDVETIRRKAPQGLLLAGGPGDQAFDDEILRLGIPVLSMGFCTLTMAKAFDVLCEGALLTGRASQITFLSISCRSRDHSEKAFACSANSSSIAFTCSGSSI